jgi:hypothetical protein
MSGEELMQNLRANGRVLLSEVGVLTPPIPLGGGEYLSAETDPQGREWLVLATSGPKQVAL